MTQPRRRVSTIDRADSEVPIQEVLASMGIVIPSEIVGSWKTRCPFWHEHADGGLDPNCRAYPSNTLHCFAAHGTMRPSQIEARRRGVSRLTAARDLLDERGLLRPATTAELWARAEARRTAAVDELGASGDMVRALQAALERANVPAISLDEEHTAAWHEALEALDAIFARPTSTADDLREWLATHTRRLETVRQRVE